MPGSVPPFAASPPGSPGGPSQPDAPRPVVAHASTETAAPRGRAAGGAGRRLPSSGARRARSVEDAAMRGTGEGDPGPPELGCP